MKEYFKKLRDFLEKKHISDAEQRIADAVKMRCKYDMDLNRILNNKN